MIDDIFRLTASEATYLVRKFSILMTDAEYCYEEYDQLVYEEKMKPFAAYHNYQKLYGEVEWRDKRLFHKESNNFVYMLETSKLANELHLKTIQTKIAIQLAKFPN